MSAFQVFSWSAEDFSGTARLFPLPNLMLFPHVMQPLHVFEPRYCDLVEEAMEGDRLITMATLADGWENDYEGRPLLLPTACLGGIVACHKLEDDQYNVLLVGLQRVHLLNELPPAKRFREARVELCEDQYPADDAARGGDLQRRLREAITRFLPEVPQAKEQLSHLFDSDIPLGIFTDVISYMIDIDLTTKESLLAELDVHRRANLLLEHLEAAAVDTSLTGGDGEFPPGFSLN